MIKLLVVDDQPQIRRGLRMRLGLEPDLVMVGEAADGQEAIVAAGRLRPDVVVMDAEMPNLDGIRATERLGSVAPRTAVIILSIHDDVITREKARAAGAVAFVAKQAGDRALLDAIYQAARGA
jgi:DNA-binding NarL/FixJ family response regulator